MISIPISKPHISFFHLKIFNPSNGPKGRRLNNAKNIFIKAIKNDTEEIKPSEINHIIIKIKPKIRLVDGPAAEILPISSLFGLPNICTAPGAANTIPAKIPNKRANNNPCGYIRNSDQ